EEMGLEWEQMGLENSLARENSQKPRAPNAGDNRCADKAVMQLTGQAKGSEVHDTSLLFVENVAICLDNNIVSSSKTKSDEPFPLRMEHSQSAFSLYEPYQNGRVPVVDGAGREGGRGRGPSRGRKAHSGHQPSSVAMGTDTESAGSICCTSRQGVGAPSGSQVEADVEGPEQIPRRRLGSQALGGRKGTEVGTLLFSPWLEKLKSGSGSSGLGSAQHRSGQLGTKFGGPGRLAKSEVIPTPKQHSQTGLLHSQLRLTGDVNRTCPQMFQQGEPSHVIHASTCNDSGGSGGRNSGGRHRQFLAAGRGSPKEANVRQLSGLQSELQTLEDPSSQGPYARASEPPKDDATPESEATHILRAGVPYSQEQIMRDVDSPQGAKERVEEELEEHTEEEVKQSGASRLCEGSQKTGKGRWQCSVKMDVEVRAEMSGHDGSGDMAEMVAGPSRFQPPSLRFERPTHRCEEQIPVAERNGRDGKVNINATIGSVERMVPSGLIRKAAGFEHSPVVENTAGTPIETGGDAATALQNENATDSLGKAGSRESAGNVPSQVVLWMTGRDGRGGAAVEIGGRKMVETADGGVGFARRSIVREMPPIRGLNERIVASSGEKAEVNKGGVKTVRSFAPFMKLMYTENSDNAEWSGAPGWHREGSQSYRSFPAAMKSRGGGDDAGTGCILAGGLAVPGASAVPSSCLHDPGGSSPPSHQKGVDCKFVAGKPAAQLDALPGEYGTAQLRFSGSRGLVHPYMGAGQSVGKPPHFGAADKLEGVGDAMTAEGLSSAQDGPRGMPAICIFQPHAKWEASPCTWGRHQGSDQAAPPQVEGKEGGGGKGSDDSSAESPRRFDNQFGMGKLQLGNFQMGRKDRSPSRTPPDICKKCRKPKVGKGSAALLPTCKCAGQGGSGSTYGRHRLRAGGTGCDERGHGDPWTARDREDGVWQECSISQCVKPDRNMAAEGPTASPGDRAAHDARTGMERSVTPTEQNIPFSGGLVDSRRHHERSTFIGQGELLACSGGAVDGIPHRQKLSDKRLGQRGSGKKGGSSDGKSSRGKNGSDDSIAIRAHGLDQGTCHELLAASGAVAGGCATGFGRLEADAREGTNCNDNLTPMVMNRMLLGKNSGLCGRADAPGGAMSMEMLSADAAVGCGVRVDNVSGAAIGRTLTTAVEPVVLPSGGKHVPLIGTPFGRTSAGGAQETLSANFLQELGQHVGEQAAQEDLGKARVPSGLNWGLMGILGRREQSDEQQRMPPPRFGTLPGLRKDGQPQWAAGGMLSFPGTSCKLVSSDHSSSPGTGQGQTDGEVHIEQEVVIRNGVTFVRRRHVRMQMLAGNPARESLLNNLERRRSMIGLTVPSSASEIVRQSRRLDVQQQVETANTGAEQEVSDHARLMSSLGDGMGKLNVPFFEPWDKIASREAAREGNMGNMQRGGGGNLLINTKTASGSTTASLPLEIFTRFRNVSRGGDIRGEAEISHGGSSVCGRRRDEDEERTIVGGTGNVDGFSGHVNTDDAGGSDEEKSREGIEPAIIAPEHAPDNKVDVCDLVSSQKPKRHGYQFSSHCRNERAVRASVGKEDVGSILATETIHDESLPS
ncbi:hypothetical protein CBR_g38884, partial [Chara braunii]